MSRVAAACAAVPGADEQLASRALACFGQQHRMAVMAAGGDDQFTPHDIRRMRRLHVAAALENERQARAVGVAPVIAWLAWMVARAVVERLLFRLWDWWWNNRTQPAGDEA